MTIVGEKRGRGQLRRHTNRVNGNRVPKRGEKGEEQGLIGFTLNCRTAKLRGRKRDYEGQGDVRT